MNSATLAATGNWVVSHWPRAAANETPWRHWMLNTALPEDLARGIATLPVTAPDIPDTKGKRETHNETRWFFNPGHQRSHESCMALAAAFQSRPVVGMLENLTGTDLSDTFLRIEFCHDRNGFWLEPHTDIGAKRLTGLVYLTQEREGESLGTDIYDSQRHYIGTSPGGFNRGLIFIPGSDTWHGFRARRFECVRTSLIINYVGQEWRARHELCFPDSIIRR